MYLHNFATIGDSAVSTSIFGLLRINSTFFADDGFGNFMRVDIVNAVYSMV